MQHDERLNAIKYTRATQCLALLRSDSGSGTRRKGASRAFLEQPILRGGWIAGYVTQVHANCGSGS